MADREKSCVRLFISVDLVGSTAFKNKTELETEKYKLGPPWVNVFRDFYSGFPSMFEREIGANRLAERLRPKLVKTIGDELLLVSRLQNSEDARAIVPYLADVVAEYTEKNLVKESLSLKAAAWIAGFPITNHRVELAREDGSMMEDFIGPTIDTGFRIAKFATAQKLIVSVDLALLLLTGARSLVLYFDGTECMKGVLGGRPYPIIWYKASRESDALHKAEIALRKLKVDPETLKQYCGAFIDDCAGTWLARPYFAGDAQFSMKPKWHERILEEWARVDAKLDADELNSG